MKPMFKWRCVVPIFLLMFLLGDMHVLGFHELPEPKATIIFVGTVLIWVIINAVDVILEKLEDKDV